MKKAAVVFIVVVLLLVAVIVTASQLGFEVKWWSIDGGAQVSSGDGFSLSGISGQADAGPVLAGDAFTLSGGYWSGGGPASPTDHALYLPMVQK